MTSAVRRALEAAEVTFIDKNGGGPGGARSLSFAAMKKAVAPNKSSDDDTEIFNTRTHTSAVVIGSSEDMLEIDFLNGKISQVGDQYGIGRLLR